MTDLSLFDLTGRTALITGGAIGLGRGAAIALAHAGADIAIVDVDDEVGPRTAATVRTLGVESEFFRCDVSVASEVDEMVERVVQRFGKLDVAVNNAGIFRPEDHGTQDVADWQRVIGINLTGVWLCAQAEIRQMRSQSPAEGKIINVASVAAGLIAGNNSYDASKAAVVQLTKTLAAQWGRFNINVNSISPGFVISVLGGTRTLEEREQRRRQTPMGHAQRIEDLYGPFVFLASAASDYVTGVNLLVDGGVTLQPYIDFERTVPPRVDPGREVLAMNEDLDDRGVDHDADGIIHET